MTMLGTDPDAETATPVPPDEVEAPPRFFGLGARVSHVSLLFALSVASLSPGIFRSGSQIFGYPGDSGSAMWIGWRIGEILKSGRLPTRFPDIFWPYGFDLLASDGYGPNLLMGIFNVLTGSPTLSYNLVLLSGVFVTAIGASVAASQIGAGRGVRLLVAFAAVATPILSVRLYGHPHLTFVGFPLLAISEVLRATARGAPLRWKRTAGFLYLTYLCGSGFLMAAGIVMLVVLLIDAVRRHQYRQPLLRFGGALLICLIGMSPFLVARLAYTRDEAAATGGKVTIFQQWLKQNSIDYETEQGTFFIPPSLTMLDEPDLLADAQQRTAALSTESSLFLGAIPVIGLALFFAFRSRLRLPVLAASFALWMLAAGPTLRLGLRVAPLDLFQTPTSPPSSIPVRWLPFEGLRLVPGLDSMRTSGRFLCVLPALAALGLVPAWQYLRTRLSKTVLWGLAAVLIAVAVPVSIWSIPTYRVMPTGEVAAAFATMRSEARPTDTVAVVPSDCYGFTDTNLTMIEHRQRMVGCLGPFSAVRWYSEMDLYMESLGIASLSCQPALYGPRYTDFATAPPPSAEGLADLRERFGVRYLIVRDDFYGALCTPERAQEIRNFVATLPVIGTNGNVTVIDLGAGV